MRRLINLILIGLAFYGGLKFERLRAEEYCKNHSGTWTGRVCAEFVR